MASGVITVFGGLRIPVDGLCGIFRNSVAALVHDREIELCDTVTAFGGFGIPFGGLDRIGRNTVSVLVFHAEIELFLCALAVTGSQRQNNNERTEAHAARL